ncbi:MAG: septum formation family protein [Nocardioidaceae bacterium]
MRSSSVLRTASIALLLLVLSGCTQGQAADGDNGSKADTTAPTVGACRALGPDDIAQASNATTPIACTARHTAETYSVGTFPATLAEEDPDDRALGAFVYDRCQGGFQKFLGGTESLVLRSTMTWAWFRPSKDAWAQGARWFRCDVVGGGEQSKSFVTLPKTAKGLLLGKPDDRWLVCVDGPSVSGSVKIPCSTRHTWRAVTTISLGQTDDDYPGDRLVEVRTRDFCSRSVAAWLNYPIDYDYGFTWFHEAEWKAGNRRSICWAKTDQ